MLTSKQRAELRSMANDLQPIFQIGKDGINDNLIKSVCEALEKRELIKITVLETADLNAHQACDIIAERTGAHPVQSIGRKFVLYKESSENKRIEV